MGRRESHKKTGLKDYGAKFNQPILGRKGEVAPRTLFMERATQAPLIEQGSWYSTGKGNHEPFVY